MFSSFNNTFGPSGPCKDCEDRELLCHSKCESYINWKAAREAKPRRDKEYLEYKHDMITKRIREEYR